MNAERRNAVSGLLLAKKCSTDAVIACLVLG